MISVIALGGELDLSRRTEIHAALALSGAESGVLVDLAQVTYCDSTVLGELLRFQREALQAAVPVAVLIGDERFKRIARYAGLGDAFALFEDRNAALSSLGPSL